MRTTLTLDDDVARRLEQLRRSRKQPFRELVNEALRRGLKHMATPPRRRTHFRTDTVNLGRCLIGDVDNIAEVLAVADRESYR